jgi:hypothetical protein
MPTITAAGTITYETPQCEFLKRPGSKLALMFSGSTLPTTLQVGANNDAGTFVPFTGGDITSLPTSMVINSMPSGGVVIVATGGSPNFNVSSAGDAGPLKP